VKVYPLSGSHPFAIGDRRLALRAGDAAELKPLLRGVALREVEIPPPGDRDGDGIPDPLDVLIGAKKTALNGAAYGAGYIQIPYPGGDIPRHQGVCTDVVIRAVRNAGLDLQRQLHVDIGRAPRSYPMVKKRNPNIDHRRVKTLLPLFKRRWNQRSAELRDPDDPLRPGDVVFMDTFPNKRGPDHIGVLSDTLAPSGLPMVINNWTNGFRTSEMDLLDSIPVTHRFRLAPSKDRAE
jgi:uncharacterized protein YijF (DUF1287 family)